MRRGESFEELAAAGPQFVHLALGFGHGMSYSNHLIYEAFVLTDRLFGESSAGGLSPILSSRQRGFVRSTATKIHRFGGGRGPRMRFHARATRSAEVCDYRERIGTTTLHRWHSTKWTFKRVWRMARLKARKA